MGERIQNKVKLRAAIGRLAWARLRSRWHDSVRTGYIGGHGDDNLGDNAMFHIAQELLAPGRVVSFERPFVEKRLGVIRLSGPRHFRQVVLGGGTLINPLWMSKASLALRQGTPVWSLGTGAGSCGFGQNEGIDLRAWQPLLRDFVGVGVRGPRSVAALADIGVEAEIIGDLALARTANQVTPASEPPKVALNITLPESGRVQDVRAFVELRAALEGLLANNWTVVPLAMNPADVAPLRCLLSGLVPPDRVLCPRTMDEFMGYVRDCRFAVVVRLHAAVFSCCSGIPVLAIGYRSKCLDFMEAMGLARWHTNLYNERQGVTAARLAELGDAADELRAQILPMAQRFARQIPDYIRRMCDVTRAPAAQSEVLSTQSAESVPTA